MRQKIKQTLESLRIDTFKVNFKTGDVSYSFNKEVIDSLCSLFKAELENIKETLNNKSVKMYEPVKDDVVYLQRINIEFDSLIEQLDTK
jgi:hypothetical protein